MINKKAKLVKNIKKTKLIPTRNGYGDGLVEIAAKNKDVVVITADLSDSTRAGYLQAEFPERFIEVGVAEQNMMSLAAGLAMEGKIPFVSSYAVFSPGRNWDQMRVNVCYNDGNVKIAGAHTGVSVGPDGATHQALEDIAIARVLPNITVIAPLDYEETRKATIAAAKHKGPAYFRFAREKTPVITTPKSPFKIGKANVLKEGQDLTIVGAGPVLVNALLAAVELEKEKISVEVINSHTIKPLDEKTILKSAKKTNRILTIEEHQITGGLGSAVSEYLSETYPVYIKRLGIPDTFGESGKPEELIVKFGLDTKSIANTIRSIIQLGSR